MLRIILFVICVNGLNFSHAQDLYQPRDVKAAYKKGTRSPDGKPGKNYWQNHGRYDITITAEPPGRTIRGREKITYFNNSPDTLENPVIKLIMNIHKPGALRYQPVSADYLSSGVTIDALSISGTNIAWPDGMDIQARCGRFTYLVLYYRMIQLTCHWNGIMIYHLKAAERA